MAGELSELAGDTWNERDMVGPPHIGSDEPW
jgi:hypothetical protein